MNTTSYGASLAILVVLGCGTVNLRAKQDVANDLSVQFIGTSPCGESIQQLLRISSNPEPEIIQWKLTLHEDPKTHAPSRYELHCQYGLTAPNKPGLAKNIKTLDRQGTWTIGKGFKSNPTAVVYELDGTISFFQLNSNILHVLTSLYNEYQHLHAQQKYGYFKADVSTFLKFIQIVYSDQCPYNRNRLFLCPILEYFHPYKHAAEAIWQEDRFFRSFIAPFLHVFVQFRNPMVFKVTIGNQFF